MSVALSIIAIVISGCSFFFAMLSFKKTHRIEKRQLEITEKQETERAIEQKQAKLFAAFKKLPIQSANLRRQALKDVLIIRNEGLCEARNINVRLDGKPIMEHPAIAKGVKEIEHVGPNSSISYNLAINMRVSRPRECKITWQDNSGIEGHYKTTLTI